MLLNLGILLLSSCSWVFAKPQTIELPASPSIVQCPAKPIVQGVVSSDGKSVTLPIESAKALIAWIRDYTVCSQKNEVEYKAYIEKLINRIKAVNGEN